MDVCLYSPVKNCGTFFWQRREALKLRLLTGFCIRIFSKPTYSSKLHKVYLALIHYCLWNCSGSMLCLKDFNLWLFLFYKGLGIPFRLYLLYIQIFPNSLPFYLLKQQQVQLYGNIKRMYVISPWIDVSRRVYACGKHCPVVKVKISA